MQNTQLLITMFPNYVESDGNRTQNHEHVVRCKSTRQTFLQALAGLGLQNRFKATKNKMFDLFRISNPNGFIEIISGKILKKWTTILELNHIFSKENTKIKNVRWTMELRTGGRGALLVFRNKTALNAFNIRIMWGQ